MSNRRPEAPSATRRTYPVPGNLHLQTAFFLMTLPLVAPLLAFAATMQLLYFGLGVNPYLTIALGGMTSSISVVTVMQLQNNVKDKLRGKKVLIPTFYWTPYDYWSWFIVMDDMSPRGFGTPEVQPLQFPRASEALRTIEQMKLSSEQKTQLTALKGMLQQTFDMPFYNFELECSDFPLWKRMLILSSTPREDMGMHYTRQDIFYNNIIVPAMGAPCVLVRVGDLWMKPSGEYIPIVLVQSNSTLVESLQRAASMYAATQETVAGMMKAYDGMISFELQSRATSSETALKKTEEIMEDMVGHEGTQAARYIDIRTRMQGGGEQQQKQGRRISKRVLIAVILIGAAIIIMSYLLGLWPSFVLSG